MTSAALLKQMSHGMHRQSPVTCLGTETLFPVAFFPKGVTQHLPLRIKVRTPRYRKMLSVAHCTLSSYTACREPRQTTPLGLQAPPHKLDPRRSVKHLAVENHWTFGDFCCLFAVWDWQRQLLKEGDRWEEGEQRCGWIFQAEQAAGVQTCHFRRRGSRGIMFSCIIRDQDSIPAAQKMIKTP